MDEIIDVPRELYVGFDESNHGKFPEVYVAFYSNIPTDIEKRSGLSKKREQNSNIIKIYKKREYTFLVMQEYEYKRTPSEDLLGIIAASLMQGKINKDLEKLILLFDGKLDDKKRNRIKRIISETYSLEYNNIALRYGAKFDKKYKLVNLADQMAYYIFKNLDTNQIDNNKRRALLNPSKIIS